MRKFHTEKVTGKVKELASLWIEKHSEPTSLITVTRVESSVDSKRAVIMISVLPTDKEAAAYGFIRRNLGEIRKYIIENLKVNPLPYLEVAIDSGEKNRQKIDEILKNG